MKRKLAAVTMLLIFMANLTGYRLVHWFARQSANAELALQLDKVDYHQEDLITVRIPVNIPYHEDQLDFERVDGELEIDGVVYSYVERKVFQGQVWLKCIRNKEAARLDSLRDNFVKNNTDLPSNQGAGKKQDKTTTTAGISDYEVTSFEDFQLPTLISSLTNRIARSCAVVKADLPTPERPPEHFLVG